MPLDVNQIIDRRNLERRLSFWQALATVALALVLAAGYFLLIDRGLLVPADQIARVSITGYIGQDRQRDELFEKLAETDAVKAVIVSIDSTGGATTGGEALYESLRKLTEHKPTAAIIGDTATSAAYLAAIATDHVIARRSSVTGSIGVVFQWPDVSKLSKILGIQVQQVASSPLKIDVRFTPITPAARSVLSAVLDDTHNWFVDILAERRGLRRSAAAELADGRIFTGRQALSARLIDGIGGETEAIDWFVAERSIEAELPIKDWKPRRPGSGPFDFFRAVVPWLAQETGPLPDLSEPGDLKAAPRS